MTWIEMGKTALGVKNILLCRKWAELKGYGFMGGNVLDYGEEIDIVVLLIRWTWVNLKQVYLEGSSFQYTQSRQAVPSYGGEKENWWKCWFSNLPHWSVSSMRAGIMEVLFITILQHFAQFLVLSKCWIHKWNISHLVVTGRDNRKVGSNLQRQN